MKKNSNSSLSRRLLLLVAFPLLALSVSIGVLVQDAALALQSARQTGQLIEFSVAAGDLVHALQIERAATAGFAQSKGEKFADVLPAARQKTDDRLAAFQQRLTRLDLEQLSGLQGAAERLRGELGRLGDVRGKASALTMPASETTAYFTAGVAALVDAMTAVSAYNSNAAIGKQAAAYLAFVRAKENAGQERALSMPVFVADQLAPAQYRAILERIYKQDAFASVFAGFASAEEQQALRAVLDGPAATEVKRIRAVMAEKSAVGDFGIDSAHWFKTITEKIDALYQVEGQVVQNLGQATERLIDHQRKLLTGALTLAAMALALTIGIAVWVGRGVSRPLNAVVEVAEFSVQHNDFTRAVPERTTASSGEITQLIDSIRTHIGATVSSMEQANREASKNRALVAESESALRGIGESSQRVVGYVHEIASSVREQDAALQQVANNVEQIAQMTDQSRSVSVATSQTAQALEAQAQALKTAVEKFRV